MTTKITSFALSLFVLLGTPFLLAAAAPNDGGSVQVYLQISNPTSYGHPLSDFSIFVSGQNPSESGFPGSHSGQAVLLGAGSYNITATGPLGFTPYYSPGCAGTMQQFQQSTCLISDSPAYGTPVSYPSSCGQSGYNCNAPYPQLTCAPATQTVAAGKTASFSATGGSGVMYTWTTEERSYVGVGPKLNVALSKLGNQTVSVSNGGQTATCSVAVTSAGVPSVTSTYVPKLPNTGFAPGDPMGVAFAIVILLALGFLFAPYAKKAFAAALS